ncbi:cyclic-di-AMP receptor [Anoxynatronum sibiricum]|uniref:Cyclic-di-AMP receptor n=1 Tax=Anoxynatronum sibiricum TaxID=210623 RepID=A0ABU9VSR0_9CLOT
MKLVIAIVHDEDAKALLEDLTKAEFRVTKLASTGGFLKAGNTTVLVGVEDDRVEEVKAIISDNCQSRKEMVTSPAPVSGTTGVFIPYPVEVTVGGATIFVVDVAEYLKM